MRLKIMAPLVLAILVLPAVSMAQTAPTAGATKEQSKPGGAAKSDSTASQNPTKMDSANKTTHTAKRKHKRSHRAHSNDSPSYGWGYNDNRRDYGWNWGWWLPWNWWR